MIFFKKVKHGVFHDNKIKLQQNEINTKRYTRLSFQIKISKYEKLRKTNKKVGKKLKDQKYNFNIGRMWLAKTLVFSKKESLLTESRIPKMAVCGAKVGNIKVI